MDGGKDNFPRPDRHSLFKTPPAPQPASVDLGLGIGVSKGSDPEPIRIHRGECCCPRPGRRHLHWSVCGPYSTGTSSSRQDKSALSTLRGGCFGSRVVAAPAITHAQFKTIHPVMHGNGRTRWALFHTVLLRTDALRNILNSIGAVFAGRHECPLAWAHRVSRGSAAIS